MRKNEEEQGAMLLRCGKNILLGGGVGVIACFGVLLMAALGISGGLFGMEIQYQLVVVSCVLGSFAGGAWAAGRCPAQRLWVGIAVGIGLFLFQLTLGILLFEGSTVENGGVGLLFGDLCGGAAAGLMAKGKRRRGGKAKNRKRR